MLKLVIPKLQNVKRYTVTERGVVVEFMNGRNELIIANSRLKSKLIAEKLSIDEKTGQLVSLEKTSKNEIPKSAEPTAIPDAPKPKPRRTRRKKAQSTTKEA